MNNSISIRETSSEWLEFISQMGMMDFEKAQEMFFASNFNQLRDLGQKALFAAGRGKTLSLEGNLPGSKLSHDEAHALADARNAESGYPSRDEILSYVQYEKGGFYSKYGESFTALSLYRSARRMAETRRLVKIIDYQLYAFEFEHNKRGSIDATLAWIDYFSKNGMQIMHLISERRLANYYRVNGRYPEALASINKALENAVGYGHAFMLDQIRNARGYILFFDGQIDKSREIYVDLLPVVQSHFLKSTILENLTLLFYTEQNNEMAEEHIELAIANSREHEIISRLPDECLFMGELQRDVFQRPELATHYFEEGYKASLKMAEHGFSLKGDRLKVVRAFESRSKVSYSIPERVGKQISPFAFSQGLRWREILDLFHFTLIRSHLQAAAGNTDILEKLGLKTSTYYAIKRRLGSAGYSFDPGETSMPLTLGQPELTSFNVYVNKLQDLTWTEANSQFETEIIEYLFKHAGYQKTKLAEDLDISYPTVLQKTKSLTSGD
jgi:tetratricopeptide (TPR) repeat protein